MLVAAFPPLLPERRNRRWPDGRNRQGRSGVGCFPFDIRFASHCRWILCIHAPDLHGLQPPASSKVLDHDVESFSGQHFGWVDSGYGLGPQWE